MSVPNKPITLSPITYRTDAAGRACQCAECVATRPKADALEPPIDLTTDETARISEALKRGDQGAIDLIVAAARIRERAVTGHEAEQTLMDAARRRLQKR